MFLFLGELSLYDISGNAVYVIIGEANVKRGKRALLFAASNITIMENKYLKVALNETFWDVSDGVINCWYKLWNDSFEDEAISSGIFNAATFFDDHPYVFFMFCNFFFFLN